MEPFFSKGMYEKVKHGLFFILSTAPPKQGGINFIRKISLFKSPFAKGGIFSPPLLWGVVLSAALVSFASIKG
jgi:hypothetical protein